MKIKTLNALVLAAALLGGTFFLSRGSASPSDISFFVITIGAIAALLLGGSLRRKR
ncbi:MAG TPA: hypothetical protein PLV61_01590 [Parvularculaceae bacterium]|nr:hypothetical protein [Parvularculaceae bacterium]